MANQTDTTRKVLAYYRARPGQTIHYKDVAEDIPGSTPANVNASLSRVVAKHPEYGFERHGAGNYVYLRDKENMPKEEKEIPAHKQIFEGVGITKDGSRIVRDENGVLWKLSERL